MQLRPRVHAQAQTGSRCAGPQCLTMGRRRRSSSSLASSISLCRFPRPAPSSPGGSYCCTSCSAASASRFTLSARARSRFAATTPWSTTEHALGVMPPWAWFPTWQESIICVTEWKTRHWGCRQRETCSGAGGEGKRGSAVAWTEACLLRSRKVKPFRHCFKQSHVSEHSVHSCVGCSCWGSTSLAAWRIRELCTTHRLGGENVTCLLCRGLVALRRLQLLRGQAEKLLGLLQLALNLCDRPLGVPASRCMQSQHQNLSVWRAISPSERSSPPLSGWCTRM